MRRYLALDRSQYQLIGVGDLKSDYCSEALEAIGSKRNSFCRRSWKRSMVSRDSTLAGNQRRSPPDARQKSEGS